MARNVIYGKERHLCEQEPPSMQSRARFLSRLFDVIYVEKVIYEAWRDMAP